jgi:hypothetical protein
MAAFVLAGVCLYAGVTNNPIIAVITGKATKGQGDVTDPDSITGTGGSSSDPTDGSGTQGTTAMRSAICSAATWGVNNLKGAWQATRPMPASLQQVNAAGGTDCSGFATLCYKAAKAPNPNGGPYDGEGDSIAMSEHGHKTSTPHPADLHVWDSPGHVAIEMGGGKIAEWGSGPSPIMSTFDAENGLHGSYVGCFSYLPVGTATMAGGTKANAARHFAGVS